MLEVAVQGVFTLKTATSPLPSWIMIISCMMTSSVVEDAEANCMYSP